jgi:hypothetical protein
MFWRGLRSIGPQIRHVDQINDVDSAIFVRDRDRPASRNKPQKIRMADFESSLVRQK